MAETFTVRIQRSALKKLTSHSKWLEIFARKEEETRAPSEAFALCFGELCMIRRFSDNLYLDHLSNRVIL